MWKPLIKLLKALTSNTDPGALAHGFACGLVLGFMPKDNLLWYILCIFILFLRIQRGAYAFAMLIGSLLAPLMDPVFNSIGYTILTWEPGIPYYARLLNIPFVSFTKFHNTIVMGSLVTGLALYIPVYGFFRLWIFIWRRYCAEAIQKTKLVQGMKKIPLVKTIKKAMAVKDALK